MIGYYYLFHNNYYLHTLTYHRSIFVGTSIQVFQFSKPKFEDREGEYVALGLLTCKNINIFSILSIKYK